MRASSRSQVSVGYLSSFLWFLVVPGLFVYLALLVLRGYDLPGPLDDFAREQSVPAAIILFTLAEFVVWSFRHSLPFSVGARAGLPPESRREYELANHLVEEAERVLRKRNAQVTERLGSEGRKRLDESLTNLKASMAANPFDAERFAQALQRAHDDVAAPLSHWRKGELREYAESIGVAIVVALLLRAVVVEAFKIPSGSMRPTLQVGDHIFVTKFAYGPKLPLIGERVLSDMPPKRGDVIVFEYPDLNPNNERQDFIKRVVAVPGDTLVVQDGHPIINGWQVPNCRVGTYTYGGDHSFEQHRGELFVEYLGETAYLTLYDMDRMKEGRKGPYEVQPGEVWVMGDNRNNSMDSRRWPNRRGTLGAGVPFTNIKGRAVVVWFPPSRMLVNVMGKPLLPEGASAELTEKVEECLKTRPKPENALPPAFASAQATPP